MLNLLRNLLGWIRLTLLVTSSGRQRKRQKKGNVKYTAGDIVAIAKTIADGGYSANYNVNGDDRVDIADAIKIADAIIEGTNDGDGDEQSYTTCPDGNHPHMIDLGLPSKTKWACCKRREKAKTPSHSRRRGPCPTPIREL